MHTPIGTARHGTARHETARHGTVDISPSVRFCITEVQIITTMCWTIQLSKQAEDAEE